jgi:glycosyltransferase involved in cell wall biosynthesis
MKILISAYSCEPGRGSEPGVGWNIAREVARHHQVWVLTRHDESGHLIEAELTRNPVPNLHFVYCNLPVIGGLWRLNQSGAMQLHYYLWQIQAYRVAHQLHQQVGFDVIHHVTFVKYSSPSFLSLLTPPFVWGPVGGGETAPVPFWEDFNWKNKVYETLRLTWRAIGEMDPFTAMTARKSAIAYSTTEDTAQRLRHLGAPRIKILGESGLADADIEQLARSPSAGQSPLRFISIARLLHWKGFHLGLRAFAAANLPDAEYWILGDGPEWDRLHQLAESLGIAHQVKLWGRLPRDQVLERLGECSALVHPSLHDSGGWVCLEAMAAGRPVICLNLGGPSEQVTDETGFKVPADSPEVSVKAMAAAMVRLANYPELRDQMGRVGQARVQKYYSWAAKGQHLSQLYEELAGCEKALAEVTEV